MQQPQAGGEACNSRKRGEKHATAASGGRSMQQPQAGGESASIFRVMTDNFAVMYRNIKTPAINAGVSIIDEGEFITNTKSQSIG